MYTVSDWDWSVGRLMQIGKSKVFQEKLVPLPICLPKIAHGLAWEWTWSSAVKGRWLTVWALPRPTKHKKVSTLLLYIYIYFFFFNSWFHASWFNVNKKNVQLDATVCRHLFTAQSLYMFRVSQHPSSGVLIRPRWKEVAVPASWTIPGVADTVFSTPDDGCCDTRNM